MSDTPEFPDEMILERAVEGDSEAFSMLYERYVGRIYNYIYYRTGTAVDAEDLTAKVFYRALGRISHYRSQGVPFSAWLYRIAHNLVANWYRDNSRKQEVPLEDQISLHSHADYPEQALVEDQEKENLLKTIRKLPQERQELLILKFIDRLSNSEIALIMGRSEGAIKSLYHRTLLTLRDEIENK
ncbi:MAG: sigma-70 family RNA polymerase sigma factor [Anaerolineaceae bacterium]|nr:sigma-70 family RNA polymerase sigma factor [Anaerolineaceae bacterium]